MTDAELDHILASFDEWCIVQPCDVRENGIQGEDIVHSVTNH